MFNEKLDVTSESLINELLNNINFIIENYESKKKIPTIEAIIRINTKNILEREIKNYDNDKKLFETKSKLLLSLLEKQIKKLEKDKIDLEKNINDLENIIEKNKFKVEFFDGFQKQWCK